ncbi:MAG: cell division protein FtsQ/DivIB [Anaerovoracaceae bacterium]|jgi:cell division protein FtsQ
MYEDDRTEELPERSYYTVDENYNGIAPEGDGQDTFPGEEGAETSPDPYGDGEAEPQGPGESQTAGYDYSKSPGYDAVFGEKTGAPAVLRKKKKHRKKHYFLKFCLAVFLIAVAVYFMMSPYFDVKKIVIKGNSSVTSEQVLELSGVKTGDHIFEDLLTKRFRIKRSLEKETYIKDVSLSSELPGTLIITVTERKNNCVILVGKKYLLLDDTGYVIKKLDKRPADITLLQGVKIKSGKTGQTAEADSQKQLEEMLDLIKDTNDGDLFFKKVVYSESVTRCYVSDTLTVKGTSENIDKHVKNGNLKKVLYDLYKKGTKTGTVSVGSGKYMSFSPKLE